MQQTASKQTVDQSEITGQNAPQQQARSRVRPSRTGIAAALTIATGLSLGGATEASATDLSRSALPGVETRVSQLATARELSPRETTFAALDGLKLTLSDTEVSSREIKGMLEIATGCNVELLSSTTARREGFSERQGVELNIRSFSGSQLLDRFTEELSVQSGQDITWQIHRDGRVQIGTKSDLSSSREREIYDVRDLLFRIPNFANAPTLDLDAALAGGQGGSLFGDPGSNDQSPRMSQRDALEELRDLIVDFVESEQWAENGGNAKITMFRGTLIIEAPEYIHRQLVGRRA